MLRLLFLLPIIALFAVACTTSDESPENISTVVPSEDSVMGLLEESRSRWDSLEYSDYDFVMNWQCFCIPDYTASVDLSVRGDVITTGEYTPDSGLSTAVELTRYETVDGLFDLIADAIDQEAHSIQVTYHPEQGYPESVFIDYSEMIADEERGFVVTAVTAEDLSAR